jgi:prepilin-type N-terminal cleavage/methylation domain-containing protein
VVRELPVSRLAALRRRARDQRGLTLIELLIGLIISGILSTMVLLGWFSMSSSYSYSIASNNARDSARQALSRMSREIRDAEAPATSVEAALVRCRPRWIELYTTFNEVGNDVATKAPHLVMYRLYSDGELWRFEDLNNDGIGGVTDGDTYLPTEQAAGEGATLLCSNLVNDKVPSMSNPTALFAYSSYLPTGKIDVQNNVISFADRSKVISVQIHLLVDLNPSHSPIYADLQTSAQIRNQR